MYLHDKSVPRDEWCRRRIALFKVCVYGYDVTVLDNERIKLSHVGKGVHLVLHASRNALYEKMYETAFNLSSYRKGDRNYDKLFKVLTSYHGWKRDTSSSVPPAHLVFVLPDESRVVIDTNDNVDGYQQFEHAMYRLYDLPVADHLTSADVDE